MSKNTSKYLANAIKRKKKEEKKKKEAGLVDDIKTLGGKGLHHARDFVTDLGERAGISKRVTASGLEGAGIGAVANALQGQLMPTSAQKRRNETKGRLRSALFDALAGGALGGVAGGGIGYVAEKASKELALKGDQKKIDINKNDKIDGADLAMLRNQKKVVKGEIVSKEAILYLARNKEAFSKDQLQALLAQGKGLANQAVGKAKSLAPTLAIGQALQNPNVQNALGGAALGAGAGGLSYLLSRDKDKSLGNRLLTGAALGGITGGAYNRAKNYFRGPQLAEDRADFVGPRQPAEYRDDFVGPPRPGPFDAGPGNVQPGDADNNPFKQSAEKLARLFGRRRSSSRSSSRGRGGYGVSTGASSRSIRSSSRGGYGSSRGRTSYRRPAPVAKAAPAKPAPKPAPKAAPKPVSDKGNVSMGRSNTKADKAQAGQMAERSGIARQKAKDDAARETRKRKASQPASKGNLSMGRSNTQADQQYAKQMAAKSKPKAAPSRANLTVGGKSTDSLKQKKAAPKSKGPIIDAYWGR